MKGGTMAHIQLIYGDEPQLIEEEKRKFLSAYPDLPVTVLDDEDLLFVKAVKIAMLGFHYMNFSWNITGITPSF